MSRTYVLRLTGAQLRVLREILAMVGNDPDWAEHFGSRDWTTLQRTTDTIAGAHVDACRAEAIPATEAHRQKEQ